MTENKDEAVGNDAENNSYLFEPFITADGLEVPPPTRPMGPRRLARYRDDVASYLRAKRDGRPLPEEPVAFMPNSAEDQGVTEETLAVQRKFAALSAMGDIKGPDEANDITVGGKDQREDAAVADATPVPQMNEATSSPLDLVAVDHDATTDITYGGDVIVDEDEDTTSEYDALAGEESASDSEQDFSENQAEASGAVPSDHATEHIEVRLPLPVPALKAQGLDLSTLDRSDDDEVEAWEPLHSNNSSEVPKQDPAMNSASSATPVHSADEPATHMTPWTTSEQLVVSQEESADETQITEDTSEPEEAHTTDEASSRDVLATPDDSREPVEEKRKSSAKTGLLLFLLMLVVLIAVTLFFVL